MTFISEIKNADAIAASNVVPLFGPQPRQVLAPNVDQAAALTAIDDFMPAPAAQMLTINGPAGTGKTTLLGMIEQQFAGAVVCALSNKAVGVLRRVGFKHATTIDRVLNKTRCHELRRPPTQHETDFYIGQGLPVPDLVTVELYEKSPNLGANAPVVVDESSMVNAEMRDRLLGMFPKLVFVGDAFQLPPVEGEKWFQTHTHDVTLTHIHRTSAMSEINILANMIRIDDPTWHARSWTKEVTMTSAAAMDDQCLAASDVVLCWKNKTCDWFNPVIRELKGLAAADDPLRPGIGDKLMSWQSPQHKLLKSEIYQAGRATIIPGGYNVMLMVGDKPQTLKISAANLLEQKTAIIPPFGFEGMSYAHAMTTHKAQGSEFDRVVVYVEHPQRGPMGKDFRNWLYTAVTRARTHLTVVL